MSGQQRTPAAGIAAAAEPPGPPQLFAVYWREGPRRQLFAYRAQVRAGTAAEAREGFRLPRGPQPRVLGVKLLRAEGGGGCAVSGRWVG